jgi:hypothetical protein
VSRIVSKAKLRGLIHYDNDHNNQVLTFVKNEASTAEFCCPWPLMASKLIPSE